MQGWCAVDLRAFWVPRIGPRERERERERESRISANRKEDGKGNHANTRRRGSV